MKKIGKAVFGLIAAVAMLFTGLIAPVTAMAAGEYSITIGTQTKPVTKDHTFEAYQVFAGDLSEKDNDVTLSNISWGNGVKGSELLTALKSDTTLGTAFASVNSAADVAAALTAENAAAFAKVAAAHLTETTSGTGTYSNETYTISGLAAGYYLVKDKDDSLGDKTEAYTEFILQVVKNVTVAPKADVPTVEKKVWDTNDSATDDKDANDDKWSDSADHDINDTVKFQLTGSLPSNYDAYTTYAYTFTDTLSKGLTLDQNNIKVYAVQGAGDAQTRTEIKKLDAASTDKDGYTVATANYTGTGDKYEGGNVLTINFADLKQAAAASDGETLAIDRDTKIVVEYNATLNANAVIGSAGNPNKVDLTFSNNPNGEGEGKTPEDVVTVFTFKIVANKVDENNQALEGAGFTLYKFNKNENKYEAVGDEITGVTTFNFSGLDAGQYKLEETTTPAGYNTWEGLEFKIVAEHDATADDPQLTTLKFTDLNGKEITDFTVDTNKDASITVVNKKGSNLPETGGIGTTILYVAGAVCVAAAGLWFGLRRRNASR
ncbi:SpaH/EbpB family LPXTG-anchored major pilin [Bifidobacterium vespertilionis]|uniref:Isopeptide-forming domain-containing fimbrial protein n=1 Tax=Bifidobacterium vespertilionis TaxID=2562524 RepID=A0A5J5DWN0_9BIFI|nr:SpaH/EbpB family LPXTG-anchored major pilin [Bifidobacterium vespertilionis]KAA8821153.1 isopeptide-forming domain-containing fimbrial protein [Bifidobacterium vespertilionis]KAA8823616.1 isopeptide-forming domain-containing fimbrial protein [Bifidobacterium vespertilionis]